MRLALLPFLASTLLAAACGGGKTSGTTTPSTPPDAGAANVIKLDAIPIEGQEAEEPEQDPEKEGGTGSRPPKPDPGANPCGN